MGNSKARCNKSMLTLLSLTKLTSKQYVENLWQRNTAQMSWIANKETMIKLDVKLIKN